MRVCPFPKRRATEPVPSLNLQHYSTRHLAPADRHEAWVNRTWPSIAPLYRTMPSEPFDTDAERLRIGALVVHYSRITAQHWERSADMLRAHDPDMLNVAITLAGQAQGIAGDIRFRTGAGSVHLIDLAQTSAHHSTASRTILASVPREIAAARGLDVSGLHGAVLRSGAAGLLAPHLLGIRDAAAELEESEAPMLERTILDLLCLAVSSSGRLAGSKRIGAQAAAMLARQEIERLLVSPTLSVAGLCRTLSISRTGLHRLFEAEGGVQAYIRGRRLEAARRALADPGQGEPIQAIAEQLGFSDASHLGRLFRIRYGMTPGEFRACAEGSA